MKQNFKKLSLSFIATSVFSIGLYFLITLYDKSGITIVWIKTNIQYFIFLYLSIIVALSLYPNKDKKSKLILSTIILINFLYIIFSFGIAKIGLNNTQGLFLIGFLILAFISTYIKNLFGYIITIFSLIGVFTTIGSSIIPLYESGPDIIGFENQVSTQLLTYSKVNINKTKANILIDNKEYILESGLIPYKIKINKSGSKLLFKSDRKYLNTYGYILFPNKEIIQIYPQSALNIKILDNKYQIEIIAGVIKHKANTGQTIGSSFYFTGKLLSYGIIDDDHIKQITDFYDTQLKVYIQNQIGGEISNNKIITLISKYIITLLSKIIPGQFEDNLENFNNFQLYVDPYTQNNLIKFNNEKINNSILKDISDSLETTKIIK